MRGPEVPDPIESIFRTALRTATWLRRTATAEPAATEPLEPHRASLTALAAAVAGESLSIEVGRGVGGVRGADLLLPETCSLAPTRDANRELFRVRCAIGAAMWRIAREGATAPVAGAEELASLELASRALAWLDAALPSFTTSFRAARELELARRPEVAALRGRDALLERSRRAALEGESPWRDAEFVRELKGARRAGRQRSPGVWLFGEWLGELGAQATVEPPSSATSSDAEPVEIEAPPSGALERVSIARRDDPGSTPIALGDRALTLDEYRGGARDAHSPDDLASQLDALRDLDLGALTRDGVASTATLRAELALAPATGDVADLEAPVDAIAYDEWDARRRAYRPGWCSVHPLRGGHGPVDESALAWTRDALARHAGARRELRRRMERLRIRSQKKPRQTDGDDVDVDALVDVAAALRAGHGGDERLYVRSVREHRDLATAVLLDVSLSSDSWRDGRRLLDVARESVLLLGEVANELGDPLEVLAFASETRHRCHVWHVRDPREPWAATRARLGTLSPRAYTRIGPALRYATDRLASTGARRKLLILVSDTKPTDYDRYEGRHGLEDVRRAVGEAAKRGVSVHALSLDARARARLPAMFGRGAWHVVPHANAAVEALATIYARETRS